MTDRPRFPWEQEDDKPERPRVDLPPPPPPWRKSEPSASPPADAPEPSSEQSAEADDPPTAEIAAVRADQVADAPPPPSFAPWRDPDEGPDAGLSVEGVSFSEEELASTPAVPDVRAERTPEIEMRSLSRRRARTLAAFADALIPPGGSALPSALGADVPARVDDALRRVDDAARQRISKMLRLLEWAPVAGRWLRPLSRLNAASAEAAVVKALSSKNPALRAAAETCKELVVSRWASDPVVERTLGYDYGCVTTEPRRARETLEILTIDREHVEECDVVVVGSGAGGAVAAKELAELGLSVVVLEEGPPHGRTGYAGAPALRRDSLYRAQGLARATGRPGARLLLGRGVGGTTLVSYGTSMRAPDPILDAWAATGLEGVDAESMRPYYERVERTLRVQPMAEELAGAAARVLGVGVLKRGVAAVLPRRAAEGCRGCGVCDAGCPSDAILSAAETYLPRAQRAGATIIAGARVRHISVEDGRARGVVAETASGEKITVRSKVVVLAAGAVHTPSLLADSALGDLTGRLGLGLSVYPTTYVTGLFKEEQYAWQGVQQSLVVTEWLSSHGLLLNAFSLGPSAAGHVIPGAGRELSARLEDLARTVTVQVSAGDAGSGRISRGKDGHPGVSYDLSETDARRLVRGASHAAGLLLASGARSVFTSVRGAEEIISSDGVAEVEDSAVAARGVRITAAAPSGTTAMGVDPATSVCDGFGAVRGVEALFVADGSVMPGSASVPPQATIMALATRTVDHLARHSALYF